MAEDKKGASKDEKGAKDDLGKTEEGSEGGNIATPTKGLSKKMIIIIAVLSSLVLVGGGVGGYLLLRSGKSAAAGKTVEKSHEKEEEKEEKPEEEHVEEESTEEGHEEGGEKQSKTKYYTIDPPFVVNIQDTDKSRFLQIKVDLMVKSRKTIKSIEANLPLIKHDLIALFSAQTFGQVSSPQGKEALRKEALRKINEVLSKESDEEAVEAVLFTSFVIQ